PTPRRPESEIRWEVIALGQLEKLIPRDRGGGDSAIRNRLRKAAADRECVLIRGCGVPPQPQHIYTSAVCGKRSRGLPVWGGVQPPIPLPDSPKTARRLQGVLRSAPRHPLACCVGEDLGGGRGLVRAA